MVQFSDPGNEFIKEVRPHARQKDFLSIPDDVFEALYGGAAYGGKSFLLTLLPLIRGWYKFRGFRGIILRRKFSDLEREIIRLSRDYYPLTGATYNETKHTWEWKEYGSYVDFGHVQHASDIRQYDSAQYNYCAFDELTSFEEAPYIYMVGSRIRPSSSFNVALVRNGSNPGGVGQTFVYNRFVRPCEEGYKRLRDKNGLSRMYIPCLPQDNPYGMEYDPQYLQKLEILPEAEKKAKKYGDWHAFEGSVFTEFRPIRFPGEPDNALHVIEPFTIPDYWPRILSVDWGKRAMCHALWAAISPDNRVYLYRERHWKGRDVPFWASEIREVSFGENIVNFILCGSAWQERGVETISQQVQRYSGLTPSSSDNSAGSRVAGLQSIHDFLRWKSKTLQVSHKEFYDFQLADKIFRNLGQDELNKYKAQFLDEEKEGNLPKLLIFDGRCPVLVDTIPVCVYSDKKTEDIQEFDGDDPIDNLRYLCKAVVRYLSGSSSELEYKKKVQNIISRYEETGDTTAFYRMMEKVEEKKNTFGVRRRGMLSGMRRH